MCKKCGKPLGENSLPTNLRVAGLWSLFQNLCGILDRISTATRIPHVLCVRFVLLRFVLFCFETVSCSLGCTMPKMASDFWFSLCLSSAALTDTCATLPGSYAEDWDLGWGGRCTRLVLCDWAVSLASKCVVLFYRWDCKMLFYRNGRG